MSESPLEYNIWGSISGSINGDVFMNKGFSTFLNNLPTDKCVIINCNDELSYALQNDILSLYIIKNSNLHFLNNGYLKYTRKDLLKIKKEIKDAEDSNKKFNLTSENSYHYNMYMIDRIGFDNWLKKDEIMLNESIDDVKKKCK
ncbi:hypothetical protein [Flavobacterium sp.]|uniref:hypothetical protein n=1 Tax=Flavobacterium sp. TaxID=239 RepID=UPI00374C8F06